ncbi:hypothetical protein ACLOAU_12840 [Niabella sp. CJ426]|jgi:hypothetical protein|uniref:hypothetical protein n=1 Tax=Niabella sp. CJ426 TaxID=3393740 RepID=UPI003D01B3B7
MKREILKTTFVAGTLDILGAFAYNYITRTTPPDIILRYIASGLFGKTAFSGGGLYPLIGLICHFLIVLSCVVVYFKLFPRVSLLRRNILLSALLIALVAWGVTTLVIIPLSKIGTSSPGLSAALTAIAILFFCIGLPIAFFTRQYFKQSYTSRYRH